MKSRYLFGFAAFLLLTSLGSSQASAADPTNLIRVPVQRISPLIPILDVSTAVPTGRDILAVPVPRPRNLLNYPVQAIRYGLNVSPAARVAQRNGFMLIEF